LVTGSILNRLFNPTPETNSFGHTVYSLWSNDGMVPPPFNGKTFDGTHDHYLVSGSADIDSGDLLDAIHHIREHGYGLVDSSQKLLCTVNETESEVIQGFRAGVENNNSRVSKYDFIPASNQPVHARRWHAGWITACRYDFQHAGSGFVWTAVHPRILVCSYGIHPDGRDQRSWQHYESGWCS
jgi:hypothetical protein